MNNHATVQSSAPVSAAPLLQVSGALIAIIALILAAAWLVNGWDLPRNALALMV